MPVFISVQAVVPRLFVQYMWSSTMTGDEEATSLAVHNMWVSVTSPFPPVWIANAPELFGPPPWMYTTPLWMMGFGIIVSVMFVFAVQRVVPVWGLRDQVCLGRETISSSPLAVLVRTGVLNVRPVSVVSLFQTCFPVFLSRAISDLLSSHAFTITRFL